MDNASSSTSQRAPLLASLDSDRRNNGTAPSAYGSIANHAVTDTVESGPLNQREQAALLEASPSSSHVTAASSILSTEASLNTSKDHSTPTLKTVASDMLRMHELSPEMAVPAMEGAAFASPLLLATSMPPLSLSQQQDQQQDGQQSASPVSEQQTQRHKRWQRSVDFTLPGTYIQPSSSSSSSDSSSPSATGAAASKANGAFENVLYEPLHERISDSPASRRMRFRTSIPDTRTEQPVGEQHTSPSYADVDFPSMMSSPRPSTSSGVLFHRGYQRLSYLESEAIAQASGAPASQESRSSHHRANTHNSIVRGRLQTMFFPEDDEDAEERELDISLIKEGTGRRVRYGDFSSIDWTADFAKERFRLKKLRDLRGYKGKLLRAFDASQAWISVALVGIAVGILASSIDVSYQWLSDIRSGYCTDNFYLKRQFCCVDSGSSSQSCIKTKPRSAGLIDDQTDGDHFFFPQLLLLLLIFHGKTNDCKTWIPWTQAFGDRSGFAWGYVIYVVMSAFLASLAAYLVRSFAPYASGSGLAECKVMLAGFVIRGFLGLWTLIIKCVGMTLAVASGLSLGKQGPLVHMSCCVGNVMSRIFAKYANNEGTLSRIQPLKNVAKKREILSAACAAGVSVAFGAPIGGVLFSLEEVSYYFPYKTLWRTFFCAMIAAGTVKIINPLQSDRLVLFQISSTLEWRWFELFFFVFCGAVGGVFGALFVRAHRAITNLRRSTFVGKMPIVEAGSVALITALINFPNKFTKVSSYELLAALFDNCRNETDLYFDLCNSSDVNNITLSLIFTLLTRIVLTTYTLGLKLPSGLFVPLMAIGATFGRLLGISVKAWQTSFPGFFLFTECAGIANCIDPGIYAVMGAAACVAGVTRMTVSLVVIMFELTGSLTFGLPVMLTVMVSKWVGDALTGKGIYDEQIKLNKFPYLDHKEDYPFSNPVSNVMTPVRSLQLLPQAGLPLWLLEKILLETTYKGFLVVESIADPILVGYISRSEIQFAIDEAKNKISEISASSVCIFGSDIPNISEFGNDCIDFTTWMDASPTQVTEKHPMDSVLDLFRKLGLRYVVVTKRSRVVGFLTRKDVTFHMSELLLPRKVGPTD